MCNDVAAASGWPTITDSMRINHRFVIYYVYTYNNCNKAYVYECVFLCPRALCIHAYIIVL